ncbi:unnamed protein product [Ilex paraguariensis]|uniref:Uncharacterized protein n=1 Tax=Ilex paraguariensis TaxID=185542 RepID=A0ABC8UWT6_9AQUA
MTGILMDSSSPPCLSPLLPIATHTPETHVHNSSPIELSHASRPIIESHTNEGNNELPESPNNTGSPETFPPQEPHMSDKQHITAQLRVIETLESFHQIPIPSAPWITRWSLGPNYGW